MLNISITWLAQNKRLFIVSAFALALAANFWAGSRVPSLNDKATLGGDLILEDPLGFEAAYPVDPGDPLMERIFYTTVNWILTNRQGMTFGILIAAAFMTLLSLLQRSSFSSHYGNTLLGLFIGVPLGVCVNCAAPIARGLHESGSRLETTLVTMISSPTLNIIVLTMLFSLMPLYMAVTKVAMTLFFLLAVVPFLARTVFKDQLLAQTIDVPDGGFSTPGIAARDGDGAACEIAVPEPGWIEALRWVIATYAANLFTIIKLTLPLMLLAGIMGAAAITLFPWQQMADLFSGGQWYLLALGAVLIAAAGLFLPVPIAFDVAIVAALLAAGVPPLYAMILLFTLGIFSVYSFFIIWTGISRRVAVVLTGILLVMGLLSGVVVELFLEWDESRQQALFEQYDLGSNRSPVSSFFFAGAWAGTENTIPAPVHSGPAGNTDHIRVTETRMQKISAPAEPMFTRHYGEELGLVTESDVPVGYRFMPPLSAQLAGSLSRY